MCSESVEFHAEFLRLRMESHMIFHFDHHMVGCRQNPWNSVDSTDSTLVCTESMGDSKVLHIHTGHTTPKNFLTCGMHRLKMSLKGFLACSSTVSIYFFLDLNINTPFRPRFLLLSVPSTISFAFIILARKTQRLVELKSNIIDRLILAMMSCTASDFKRAPMMQLWQDMTEFLQKCGQATRTSCSQGKEKMIQNLIQIQRMTVLNTILSRYDRYITILSFCFVSIEHMMQAKFKVWAHPDPVGQLLQYGFDCNN